MHIRTTAVSGNVRLECSCITKKYSLSMLSTSPIKCRYGLDYISIAALSATIS